MTRIMLAFGLVVFSVVAEADIMLDWWTVDGGGAMWSTGGTWELGATIGQPDAGPALTGGGWELTGGFWVSAIAAPPICTGDMNCDGIVSFKDINPFVVYLSSFSEWQSLFVGCPPANGDINYDGTYPSFKDINSFVVLLCSTVLPIPCP